MYIMQLCRSVQSPNHTKLRQINPLRLNQTWIKSHKIIQNQITPKSHLKHPLPPKKRTNRTKRHKTTPKTNKLRHNLTSIISHQIIQKQITPKSHNKTDYHKKNVKSHQTTPKDTKPHQKQTNSDIFLLVIDVLWCDLGEKIAASELL